MLVPRMDSTDEQACQNLLWLCYKCYLCYKSYFSVEFEIIDIWDDALIEEEQSMKKIPIFLAFAIMLCSSIPAKANEWVTGTVSLVWDYGGYGLPFDNALITLTQMR